MSTEEARKILPRKIAFEDGIFNCSRTAILISSLITGNDEMLKYGFQDRFHQDYRGKLIPYYNRIMDYLDKKEIIGRYLSGAGSTIMAVCGEDNNSIVEDIEKVTKNLDIGVKVLELELDRLGFTIIDTNS